MIVKFFVNSGASIHSTKEVEYDLDTEKGVRRFGYSKEEWLNFSHDEKDEILKDWVDQTIEFGYEEND